MILRILITLASASVLVANSFAQQVCNGYAEFCNRSYGNITFIGAHDSAFVSSTGTLTANQHYDVTRQLTDGIRLLQSQGHTPLNNSTGGIELCHTNCEILDAGTLVSYLQSVKSWLDQNQNEVLTILFTNSDGIDVRTWAADFESTGIADMAYVPPFTTTPGDTLDWPTLGSMISSGKRVVVFLDAGADQSVVDYILPEFTYMWETPFDQTNQSFPCVVNRPPSLVGQFPTGRLSLINHFLDTELTTNVLIPDISALNVTNSLSGFGSLGLQVQECAAIYGRNPNFLLVDYYDVPDDEVFRVAAQANGVSFNASPTSNPTHESTPTASGVPSSAAAKKVLPVFVILQLVFSGLTIGTAFWLARDEGSGRYGRLPGAEYSTIRPRLRGHKNFDSIASVQSDAALLDVERGVRGIREHRPTESMTDLAASAALMGTSSRPQSRRGSIDSVHSDEDADIVTVRRMLDSPRIKPAGGYLQSKRDSLFIG